MRGRRAVPWEGEDGRPRAGGRRGGGWRSGGAAARAGALVLALWGASVAETPGLIAHGIAPGASIAQVGDACARPGWQHITTGGESAPVWGLAASPEGDLALAGLPQMSESGFSLFRGRPQDLTWTGVPDLQGVPVAATAIALGPARDLWVGAIGAEGNVYLSQDAGRTFSTAQSPIELRRAASMVMAGGVDGVVAAAYRGEDLSMVMRWDGAGWGSYGDLTGVHANGSRMLWDVAMGRDGRGWLSVDARGLWRLDNPQAGAWQPVGDTSLTTSTVLSILTDDENVNRVFVGFGPSFANPGATYQRGVRTSVDGGDGWSPATLTQVGMVTALALTAGSDSVPNDRVLYAGTWGDGLWRSLDGGGTWHHVPGPPNAFVRKLQIVVPAGRTAASCELVLAGTNGGLFARNLATARDYSVYLPHGAKEWDR